MQWGRKGWIGPGLNTGVASPGSGERARIEERDGLAGRSENSERPVFLRFDGTVWVAHLWIRELWARESHKTATFLPIGEHPEGVIALHGADSTA